MTTGRTLHIGYGTGIRMLKALTPILMDLVFPSVSPQPSPLLGRLRRGGPLLFHSPFLFFSALRAVKGVFPFRMDLETIFANLIPRFFHALMALSGPIETLSDTCFGLSLVIDGHTFDYTILNGKTLSTTRDPMARPMIRVKMSAKDMEKFLTPENARLLLIFKENAAAYKLSLLNRLSGRILFKVIHDDKVCSKILLELNAMTIPYVVLTLGVKDVRAIAAKEVRPIMKVLDGALRIEGDMEFAICFQYLLH